MSYRGVQSERIQRQLADVVRQAGHAVTWRQWVSASNDFADLGMGATQHYREQTITALFYQSYQAQGEYQTRGGMIAAGDFAVSTREQLGRQDELVWRGITYRIEGDPQPSHVAGMWMVALSRGE